MVFKGAAQLSHFCSQLGCMLPIGPLRANKQPCLPCITQAERVLQAVEACAGLGVQRSRVARIERVQHLLLWSKYARCGAWCSWMWQTCQGGHAQSWLDCWLPGSGPCCCRRPPLQHHTRFASRRRAKVARETRLGSANEQQLFHGATQVC